MATNFTNKYMQVFQDYNEFSEHSADYVRGEDHIAFLIEENEVIYWLYLEQVWRPLNVRTTTTGQLEDGRTKVAVRLEYIEGGQKYTSVPNIPDPERITSMRHFLEDYPDIEEVNVSGTVNLTDLSYAFAGSKIKDFSMLDVSNVTTMERMLYNVDDESLDIIINNAVRLYNINYIIGNKSNINKLIIHLGNTISDVLIGSIAGKINEFEHDYEWHDTNDYRLYSLSSNNSIVLYGLTANKVKGKYILLEQYHLETNVKNIECGQCYIECGGKNTGEININCERISLHCTGESNLYINSKYIVNTTHPFRLLNINGNNIIRANFGYGISVNNNFEVASNGAIGNFIFTTPIVDDTFYAKYAQYNTPISIFQYKTTFTEVADVNISSEVDSNLLYADWNIIINNYFNNINIEIYNKINVRLLDDLYSLYKDYIPRKIIIDNRNINLTDIDDYPVIEYSYRSTIHSQTETLIDKYRISGKYKVIQDNGYKICNSFMFKDIDIYSKNDIVTVYSPSTNLYNFDNNRNIKIHSKIHLILIQSNNVNFDINSLIVNNSIYISCNILNSKNCLLKIKYIENVELNIFGGILSVFRYWLENSTITNYINIKGNVFLCENNSLSSTIFGLVDNVYIKCDDDCWINYLDGHVSTRNITFTSIAKNINGIINITLTDYVSSLSYTTNNIEHIDIYNVKCISTSTQILSYLSLDNETTINLITKLIDNTDSSSKTIYMYRSQANIIGEENIAGAVAKNYEIAIIEN